MESTLFDKFSKYALEYKSMDIVSLYNRFISNLNSDEAAFVSKYFMLFYKVAEVARTSPIEIQNELCKDERYDDYEDYYQYLDDCEYIYEVYDLYNDYENGNVINIKKDLSA